MVIKTVETSRRSTTRIVKAEKNKVSKKSLSSEFDSVVSVECGDDTSPVSGVSVEVCCADWAKKPSSEFEPDLKENIDLSLVSEVSSGAQVSESLVVDTSASASPNAFSLEEASPNSVITTDIHEDSEDMRAAKYNLTSVEVNVVVEHMKSALHLIQRSAGIDNPSKKLVETLIKTVIEEFYGIPEESDLLSKIVKAKTGIVTTCLVLWMFCTLVAIYVNCHTRIPFYGPLPT